MLTIYLQTVNKVPKLTRAAFGLIYTQAWEGLTDKKAPPAQKVGFPCGMWSLEKFWLPHFLEKKAAEQRARQYEQRDRGCPKKHICLFFWWSSWRPSLWEQAAQHGEISRTSVMKAVSLAQHKMHWRMWTQALHRTLSTKLGHLLHSAGSFFVHQYSTL